MINLGLNTTTLEEAIDVMAEIILSPEFGKTLTEIHERARRKIPLRQLNVEQLFCVAGCEQSSIRADVQHFVFF